MTVGHTKVQGARHEELVQNHSHVATGSSTTQPTPITRLPRSKRPNTANVRVMQSHHAKVRRTRMIDIQTTPQNHCIIAACQCNIAVWPMLHHCMQKHCLDNVASLQTFSQPCCPPSKSLQNIYPQSHTSMLRGVCITVLHANSAANIAHSSHHAPPTHSEITAPLIGKI
jgi:hypothetical protein